MKETVAKAIAFNEIIKVKATLPISTRELKRKLKHASIQIDVLVQALLISENALIEVGTLACLSDKQIQDILAIIDKPAKVQEARDGRKL